MRVFRTQMEMEVHYLLRSLSNVSVETSISLKLVFQSTKFLVPQKLLSLILIFKLLQPSVYSCNGRCLIGKHHCLEYTLLRHSINKGAFSAGDCYEYSPNLWVLYHAYLGVSTRSPLQSD